MRQIQNTSLIMRPFATLYFCTDLARFKCYSLFHQENGSRAGLFDIDKVNVVWITYDRGNLL